MPNNESSTLRLGAFLAGVVVLLFLVCRPADPSTELALATREAIQLARDTGSSGESAVLWTGRFRLLAVAGGVAVPLLIAFWIWRASAEGEIDPAEVIDLVESLRLPDPGSQARQPLASSPKEALPSQPTDTPSD